MKSAINDVFGSFPSTVEIISVWKNLTPFWVNFGESKTSFGVSSESKLPFCVTSELNLSMVVNSGVSYGKKSNSVSSFTEILIIKTKIAFPKAGRVAKCQIFYTDKNQSLKFYPENA